MLKNLYELEKFKKQFYFLSENKFFMLQTYNLQPNGNIYDSIVNFKTFSLVNSLSFIYILKPVFKSQRFNFSLMADRKSLSLILLKLFAVTLFNYNIFNRSFKEEFPFINEIKESSKFDRLMKSFLNPLFVFQKDFIILGMIMYISYLYNVLTLNNKNDNLLKINEEKIDGTQEIKYSPPQEKETVPKQIQISPPIQSPKSTKTGKFL